MAKQNKKQQDAASTETIAKSNPLLRNIVIVLGIAVVIAVIGACIYFSFETASPLPPSSDEGERKEWLKLLSKQEFRIDKATKNVKLEEFSFQTIEELSFSRYYTEESFIECSFVSKDGNEFQGETYMGDESLICDLSGILLSLWLELGDDYTILVVQGDTERLIFNPVNPENFK